VGSAVSPELALQTPSPQNAARFIQTTIEVVVCEIVTEDVELVYPEEVRANEYDPKPTCVNMVEVPLEVNVDLKVE